MNKVPEITDRLSLPLFPLGSALFPGGLLPLQIFEVRYLDMIGKAIKAGTPFGVVTLTQGHEVRQRKLSDAGEGFADESFHSSGTLATVQMHATPQPGLLVIKCRGTQRFAINRSEQLKHGLWVADVSLLPDDQRVPVPNELHAAADALTKFIEQLQTQGIAEDEMPFAAPYQLDDCGWLANRWAELLPVAPQVKQRLVALDSPLLRLELVHDLLHELGIVTLK